MAKKLECSLYWNDPSLNIRLGW